MELGIFLLNSLKKERTKKMIEEFKECWKTPPII